MSLHEILSSVRKWMELLTGWVTYNVFRKRESILCSNVIIILSATVDTWNCKESSGPNKFVNQENYSTVYSSWLQSSVLQSVEACAFCKIQIYCNLYLNYGIYYGIIHSKYSLENTRVTQLEIAELLNIYWLPPFINEAPEVSTQDCSLQLINFVAAYVSWCFSQVNIVWSDLSQYIYGTDSLVFVVQMIFLSTDSLQFSITP